MKKDKINSIREWKKLFPVLFLTLLIPGANGQAGELLIGRAETDITPALPVAIMGQFYLRLADTVETPLTANVIALESRNANNTSGMAIMVSCDLAKIPASYASMVRSSVKSRLPGLDVGKIIINATHTHTAPVLERGTVMQYAIPGEGVTQPGEYRDFFTRQVSDAIVKAWKNRAPGSVTW